VFSSEACVEIVEKSIGIEFKDKLTYHTKSYNLSNNLLNSLSRSKRGKKDLIGFCNEKSIFISNVQAKKRLPSSPFLWNQIVLWFQKINAIHDAMETSRLITATHSSQCLEAF